MAEYCVTFQSHFPEISHINSCMLPIKKRRYLYTPEEVNNGIREDLQNLKRMRLSDTPDGISETAEDVYEKFEDNPCRALIVRPVRVDDAMFTTAVLADYPKSTLARIINLHLPNPDLDNVMKDDEMESQALIPYIPVSELLKEASFEEEHTMKMD